MNERPLILISNDDGYAAKGLESLTEMLRPIGNIVVVAPDGGRSGASLSITSREPVRVNTIKEEEGLKVYSCSGTPCDCVKIAFEKILERDPDLVLSGINHGDNAAINAHYSGTVAVATEGAMKGIPSIGFSCCRTDKDADFSPLTTYIQDIVRRTLCDGLPQSVCLNVNFPDADTFAGVKLCRMGGGEWINEWEERKDPRGKTYYWLTGSFESGDKVCDDTDLWAMQHGYIAITPLQLDLTAYDAFEQLQATLGASTNLTF